jgi:hypothetical protein
MATIYLFKTKISHLSKVSFFLLAAIYLFFNSRYISKALATRQNIYFHMPYKEITYGRQRQVLDNISAGAASFDFDVFTTPLYHPEGWQYLKHRFYDAKAKPGNKKLFLVSEPFVSKYWLDKWLERYNSVSILMKEYKITSIIIQERQYTK